MAKNLPISYEEMRGLVVDVLPAMGSGQLGGLYTAVATRARDRGLAANAVQPGALQFVSSSSGNLSRHDSARVQNILWDLLIEGIVRPGLNDGMNNDLPFFHVTDFGKQNLSGAAASPYDPDGYLKRLSNSVPALDPIIITYLVESLHTFRIGCLLSSTITLGCASEKGLLLLIAAYANALPQARQTKFRQNTEGRVIKRQFDEFSKMLESHLKGLLPGELTEDLDVALNAIFAMLRTHRNEAGHPTGAMPDREQCYASLTVFPTYIRRIYALIGWFNENGPLS